MLSKLDTSEVQTSEVQGSEVETIRTFRGTAWRLF